MTRTSPSSKTSRMRTRATIPPAPSSFPRTRRSPITTPRSPLFCTPTRRATSSEDGGKELSTTDQKFPTDKHPDETRRPHQRAMSRGKGRAASSNTPTSKDIAAPRTTVGDEIKSSCPRIARRKTRVNALMSRASTSFLLDSKKWIAQELGPARVLTSKVPQVG